MLDASAGPRFKHRQRQHRPRGGEDVPGAAADGLGVAAGAGTTNATAVPSGAMVVRLQCSSSYVPLVSKFNLIAVVVVGIINTL